MVKIKPGLYGYGREEIILIRAKDVRKDEAKFLTILGDRSADGLSMVHKSFLYDASEIIPYLKNSQRKSIIKRIFEYVGKKW